MKFYKDYYSILSIPANASFGEIKKAYYRSALNSHPDKLTNKTSSDNNFIDVTEAYNALKDEETRKEYDQNKAEPNIIMFKQAVLSKLTTSDLEDLVKYGAYLDTRNSRGQNILMIASNRGDYQIVTYLLAHNISANSFDHENNNALMFASMTKFFDFELLKSISKPEDKLSRQEDLQENIKNNDEAFSSKVSTNDDKKNSTKEKDLGVELLYLKAFKENTKEDLKQKQEEFSHENYEKKEQIPASTPMDEYERKKTLLKIAKVLLKTGANPLDTNKYNSNAIGFAQYFKFDELADFYFKYIMSAKYFSGEDLKILDNDYH